MDGSPRRRLVARVLVIDDTPAIHEDFSKILCPTPPSDPPTFPSFPGYPGRSAPTSAYEFEIVSAYQGEDGLEAVREAMRADKPFAVAFVDVRMPPGCDGVETTARLWEEDPDLQIVICTAYSDYSWAQMTAHLGTSDRFVILKKPFDVIEVQQLAHVLAEKRSLSRRLHDHLTQLEETVAQRTHELVEARNQLLVDIERREKVEIELRKLSCAVEQCPASIVITDLQGAIEYVNPRFSELTGYSLGEVRGKNPRLLKSGECPASVYERMWATITTGAEWRGEILNRKKNGELYWESSAISSIRDAQGNPTHFLNVKEDITERKRTAAELRHEQEVNVIKGRFVSMVSHEFRTPLCIIKMAASLLDGYAGRMNARDLSRQVQYIQNSVGRMTNMMEDLLLHGKFESGDVDCQPARTNLEALCRRLVAEVAGQETPPREIALRIEPDARDAFLDGKILGHILGNLLANAVQYSSANDAPVTVDVTRSAAENCIHLAVTDSGIGIPAACLPRLFQPLQRGANVGNRPGTGMGLAIVKRFVDLHRGEIRIDSIEGQGTTAWVRLPLGPPPALEPRSHNNDIP